MKVLLVNGSPHQNGCTYTALCEVAKGLESEGIDYEILHIGNGDIPGCRGCGYCKKKGECVIKDIVNQTVARADEFDGFVFGSPVYYAGPAGQLLSFMDRLFYSSRGRLAYKPAAAVVSCRRGGSTASLDRLNKYFTISNMPVVSSQYWNQVHGNSPEEVVQDLEGMQIMRALGRNMGWMLRSIDAGKKAGVKIPEPEERAWTNFIR
ncbi:MAG: flavodoxin family protein [Candidatus Methanomethylophilaceae archaeon]|nr:flavodoxin family protein [Candidatus Methanomethylophilaceae archaeon]